MWVEGVEREEVGLYPFAHASIQLVWKQLEVNTYFTRTQIMSRKMEANYCAVHTLLSERKMQSYDHRYFLTSYNIYVHILFIFIHIIYIYIYIECILKEELPITIPGLRLKLAVFPTAISVSYLVYHNNIFPVFPVRRLLQLVEL